MMTAGSIAQSRPAVNRGSGRPDPVGRVQPRPGQLLVRYWCARYDPTPALTGDLPDPDVDGPLGGEYEVSTAGAWRQPKPGSTFEDVRDLVVDHDLIVVAYHLETSRRYGGRWCGQYVVELGKKGGKRG
jgi:hypothetical protein